MCLPWLHRGHVDSPSPKPGPKWAGMIDMRENYLLEQRLPAAKNGNEDIRWGKLLVAQRRGLQARVAISESVHCSAKRSYSLCLSKNAIGRNLHWGMPFRVGKVVPEFAAAHMH
jgi:hypothetical protein